MIGNCKGDTKCKLLLIYWQNHLLIITLYIIRNEWSERKEKEVKEKRIIQILWENGQSFHLHIFPENGRKTYDCVLINAWFRGFEDDPSVMAEVFDFQHWKNLKFTWFWRKCLILNAVSKGALYLGDCIIIPCYN